MPLSAYLDLINNNGKAAALLFVNINEVNGVVEILHVFRVHFQERSKILHDVTYIDTDMHHFQDQMATQFEVK